MKTKIYINGKEVNPSEVTFEQVLENIFGKTYDDIPEEYSLIILKFENSANIPSEKNIQYEIYNPITFEKLNLSICAKNDIDISIISEKKLLLLSNGTPISVLNKAGSNITVPCSVIINS